MIALIQRVSQASVRVGADPVGAIDSGLLALVCAERDDTEREADALLDRLLEYRVFADDAGRMNLGLKAVKGFDYLLARARACYSPVEQGHFGATMQVALVNEGPVTFWLQIGPGQSAR